MDTLFQSPRKQKFEHLLVAPDNMLRQFLALIDKEIQNKKAGKEAYIIAKMNSLMEESIVKKLYEASRSGVKIDLIVRGLCGLVPGIKGLSEHIRITSIIDRHLEHARVFIFANGGNEKMYLSSADWMQRNLHRRIECAFPIFDESIKQEIKDIINIQLSDNCKARRIDIDYDNKYVDAGQNKVVRSQYATYAYLRKKYNSD
jgi:polyphosphate kinase